jgi:CobQ-like glutamine amidotransferase family enzyme
MIRLLELYPEHCNLNGDRGNLLILQKRLEWSGVTAQRFTHRAGNPLPTTRPDVVLLGHGSAAAWRQIYGDLAKITPTLEDWMKQGTQLIAVSSGYAALHGLVEFLPKSIDRRERVSKFEVVSTDAGEVIGYLNSDLALERFVRIDNFVGTQLHGPVLAKSIWLADEIIEKVLAQRPEVVRNANVKKYELVEQFATGASELASELAGE